MNQLEDEIPDVLNKAIRGLGKDFSEVARAAGMDEAELRQVLDGNWNDDILAKLAKVLNLDAHALAALPAYQPNIGEIPGVKRCIMPYRAWSVNAWLLELDGKHVLFDTGFNPSDALSKLDGIRPDAVFITHAHEDHIGGIQGLQQAGMKIISESEALAAGEFQFGEIKIKVIDLSGHCTPTASYLISGFEKSLWVVGDAIFAGSMGGCKSPGSFTLAIATLRHAFQHVDPESVILPGHGPMTSVASEISSNPFLKFFS